MKATRLASLVTAAALSTASLVSVPAAGAEEAVAPTVQTNHVMSIGFLDMESGVFLDTESMEVLDTSSGLWLLPAFGPGFG